MRKFTKRSTAIATAAVVAIGGAGAAYAAWTLNGGGSGAASAGTAQGLVLRDINKAGSSDDVTVTPAFFPGSTNDVGFTVENPNPFPVRIIGITLTVGNPGKNCPAGSITVNRSAPLPSAADLLIPAKSGNTNGATKITYIGALSMVADAADGCQGASFPITVALSANSAASNVAVPPVGRSEMDPADK